jgi:hypothetical protein
MSKRVQVSFLLDETGSMNVCLESTISGFNEYVQSLQNDPDSKFRFTLVKFDSFRMTTVYDAVKVKTVAPLTKETYRPGATTPLYDAIAQIITDTEKAAKKRKVIVVIMTDGEENASQEHTAESVEKLIKAKEEKGWAFMFLGANQDAWATAKSVGISQTAAATYAQGQERSTLKTAYRATAEFATGQLSAKSVLESFTNLDGTLKTDDDAGEEDEA